MDFRVVQLTLFFLACGVTIFVTLFYGVFTSWHKTTSGRYIFALFLSEALVLGNSLIRFMFPGQEWTTYSGIVLFAGYVVAMTAMAIGIVRATIKQYLAKEKEFEEKYDRHGPIH
jgi:hypothetical protein